MGLAQFLSRHFFTRKVIARAVVEVSSCQQTRFEVVDADADADASDVVDMDGYVFKKYDECTNLLVVRSAPLADGTRHEMEEMQAEQHEKPCSARAGGCAYDYTITEIDTDT